MGVLDKKIYIECHYKGTSERTVDKDWNKGDECVNWEADLAFILPIQPNTEQNKKPKAGKQKRDAGEQTATSNSIQTADPDLLSIKCWTRGMLEVKVIGEIDVKLSVELKDGCINSEPLSVGCDCWLI